MNANQDKAEKMLELIIKSQPQLFIPMGPGPANAEKVAAFCAGFIQKYSEDLDKMQTPSPGLHK